MSSGKYETKQMRKEEQSCCAKLISTVYRNQCLLWCGAIAFYLLPLLVLFALNPSSPTMATRLATFLVISIAAVRFVDQLGYPLVHYSAKFLGESSATLLPFMRNSATASGIPENREHVETEIQHQQPSGSLTSSRKEAQTPIQEGNNEPNASQSRTDRPPHHSERTDPKTTQSNSWANTDENVPLHMHKDNQHSYQHPFSWRIFLGTGYCYVIVLWVYSQLREQIHWTELTLSDSVSWNTASHAVSIGVVLSLAVLFALGAWCAVRFARAVWRWVVCRVRREREKNNRLSCSSVVKYALISFFSLSLCVIPAILLLIMHPLSPVLVLRLALLCILVVSGDCFVHELFSLRYHRREANRFNWDTFTAASYFWFVMVWIYGILKRKMDVSDENIEVFLPTSLPVWSVCGLSVVYAIGAWCTAKVATHAQEHIMFQEKLAARRCKRASRDRKKRYPSGLDKAE